MVRPNTATNVGRILSMLQRYQCEPDTILSKEQVIVIINKQARLYMGTDFNSQLMQEVWDEANRTSHGPVEAQRFSEVLAEAMSILQERINRLNDPSAIPRYYGDLQRLKKEIEGLEYRYEKGHDVNYDRINTCKHNMSAVQAKIDELETNRSAFQKELGEINTCLQTEEKMMAEPVESLGVSLEESAGPVGPSTHLLLIFRITCVWLILSLFILSYYPSFLSLLTGLLILYWLFLGYYDQYFVIWLMASLGLSCLMDCIYVMMWMTDKVGTHLHRGQKPPFAVAMMLLVLTVVMRLVVSIAMCPFREPAYKREYFVLFGVEVELHRRVGNRGLKLFAAQKAN